MNKKINTFNHTKTYIVDCEDNIYIGIKNFYNSFCYYITAIQRLHSSKTLKNNLEIMFKIKKNDNSIITDEIETSKKIFSILITYDKINKSNFKEITEEIIKYKDEVILPMFNESMKKGGDPQLILSRLFLPIIFHYTTQEIFIDILKELNFSKVHFSDTLYRNNEFNILTDEYSRYNSTLKKWYDTMLNYLNDDENKFTEQSFISSFKVSTLCLFFADVYKRDNAAEFAGHAVTIVLGNDNIFYVIDDDVNILPFIEYITLKRSSIHEMEIKDLTESAIDELKKIDFIKINQRYYRTTIEFEKNNENLKSFNVINRQTLNVNLIGAGIIDEKFWLSFKNNYIGQIYLVFVALLIIILIISIIQYIYKLYKIKKLKTEIEKLKEKKAKYSQNVYPKVHNNPIIEDVPNEVVLTENYKPKLNLNNYRFSFI